MTPFCKIPLASEAARKGKRIMKKFVVKRVLLSIVILFFVSMIIYAIMRCMPSSFVEQQALTLSQRPGAKSYDEWVAQLNASYGLDTGVIQGYFRWAAKAIRGQFGDSWLYNQPVLQKFASVIWYSFALGLASFKGVHSTQIIPMLCITIIMIIPPIIIFIIAQKYIVEGTSGSIK